MTSRPRAFAAAISSTLVDPQSTVMMSVDPPAVGRVERRHRQAVTLVEPARDIRLHRDAEPAQGEGHDRQSGQPIGIEVAEHEDALAPLARQPQASEHDRGIGQQAGIMEAVERVGEPGRDIGAGDRSAVGEEAGQPLRDPSFGGGFHG